MCCTKCVPPPSPLKLPQSQFTRPSIENLLLKENSFQFNGDIYLQTHGNSMGTKMVVAFVNIFMEEIETKPIRQSNIKPKMETYIDHVFSLWDPKERRHFSVYWTIVTWGAG